jgi:uncharacterized membrane protein YgcG
LTQEACFDLVPKYTRPGYSQKSGCLEWYPGGCEEIQISPANGAEVDVAWVPKETPANYPNKNTAAVDPYGALEKQYELEQNSGKEPYCAIVIPPPNYNYASDKIPREYNPRHLSRSPIYYRGISYYPLVFRPTTWESITIRQPGYVSRAGFSSFGRSSSRGSGGGSSGHTGGVKSGGGGGGGRGGSTGS